MAAKDTLLATTAVHVQPRLGSIETWTAQSGMSRRITYENIANGNLKSHKLGARTFIDIEAGLAWLRSLPPAKVRADNRTDHRARQVAA